jgi:hypothetical protein
MSGNLLRNVERIRLSSVARSIVVFVIAYGAMSAAFPAQIARAAIPPYEGDPQPYPPGIPAQAIQQYEGVFYVRDIRVTPRIMFTHLVFIDLTNPEIEFLVTPGSTEEDHQLSAQTTSHFLDEYDLQVAINGDGFSPWEYNAPDDYYPHSGDPVDALGFAASQGTIYSDDRGDVATVYISEDNEVQFNEPPDEIYNAISGFALIAEGGAILPAALADSSIHPRTAIGLDSTGHVLILAVIDGRQRGYSEGATLAELAEIMIEYGADTVVNMDGGGTSTMVMEGDNGEPIVVNSPIHCGVPGMERPGGNHLGVYAPRLPEGLSLP